jgi:hypothetical protein
VNSQQQGKDTELSNLRGLVLDAINCHDEVVLSLKAMTHMQTLLDDDSTYPIARHVHYVLEIEMTNQLEEMRESLDRLRNLLSGSRD